MTETLSVQADIAEIQRVNDWTDRIANQAHMPQSTLFAIQLCCEEVLANIVRYGIPAAPDSNTEVRLSLDCAGDAVILTIEDHGAAFDPCAAPTPARPASLEEAAIGGLGIHLMRRFTRRIDYERRDGINRLTMLIGPQPAQASRGQSG